MKLFSQKLLLIFLLLVPFFGLAQTPSILPFTGSKYQMDGTKGWHHSDSGLVWPWKNAKLSAAGIQFNLPGRTWFDRYGDHNFHGYDGTSEWQFLTSKDTALISALSVAGNDNQQLHLTGKNLSIDNGNTVALPFSYQTDFIDSIAAHWPEIMARLKTSDTATMLAQYARLLRMLDSFSVHWTAIQGKQPAGVYLVPGDTANHWVPIGDSTDLTGYATNFNLDSVKAHLRAEMAALTTGVSSVNALTGAVSLTTANIPEVTNLYYTNARADARVWLDSTVYLAYVKYLIALKVNISDSGNNGGYESYYHAAHTYYPSSNPNSYISTAVTSVTAGTGLSGGTITSTGTISLPNTGTAGTYGSSTTVPVTTTDAQGRVTGVTNTAIAFPAETDAIAGAKTVQLVAGANVTVNPTSAQTIASNPVFTVTAANSGGTVTSVTVNSVSPLFTTSTSNNTTTPSTTFTLIQQTQNKIYASPNGSTGDPSFRAMVAADVPTLNQNTTGSAAKWTTARSLAGNSVDGSADVPFTNKFLVQGTSDAGLSNAQFMGALGTGIVKNTTTTGVQSIATAGTDYQLPVTWTGVKTSNYSAAAYDAVPVDCSTVSVTVTLPTAPANNTRVWVKCVAIASTFSVTVTCGGSDVLNVAGGSASGTLIYLNEGAIFHYKASTGIWYVLHSMPRSAFGTNAFTSTAYAPLASPAFTGTPTVPTAAAGTNSTQAASTAYVDAFFPADTTISAAYTLTSRDYRRSIHCTNGSNIALTVPSGLGTTFKCEVIQEGAGTVTPTASSTTFVMIPTATTKSKQAGSIIFIRSQATANTYTIQGDLQ